MKKMYLLFSVLLSAIVLVSCNTPGGKTPGGEDTSGGGEITGKLVKSIKMVETGEEAYPTIMEFTYDDQKRMSKIAYDLYSDVDEGSTEKKEKIAAEMAFTYASDKITVENKANGAVYNTSTMIIGADGLISQIDNPYEGEDKVVFEYADKKISKVTYSGIMETVESDSEGNEQIVENHYTEVVVPQWNGKGVTKITVTETREGEEKRESITVDEFKYSNIANKANIDANGMTAGGYGMGQLFGNQGMMVNRIGDRTEYLISEVSSTYFYTYNENEQKSYVGEICTYTYTTDKDGNVTKISYVEKNFDTDGKVIDEDTGTIEVTYID